MHRPLLLLQPCCSSSWLAIFISYDTVSNLRPWSLGVCIALTNLCDLAYGHLVTAALEVSGKLIFDTGLSSRLRPRRYYTIPRESLERGLEDVEQLLNFFVIECQRIVFAENVIATSVVCYPDEETSIVQVYIVLMCFT